nr:inactive transglutaminase family protein [Polycyclovorans algicola]
MKWHVLVLAAMLMLTALGIAGYKWQVLGYPVKPDASIDTWLVEAKLSFEAIGGATRAALNVPVDPPGYTVLDENFISRGYGLSTESAGTSRRAVWTTRRTAGSQALYYRARVVRSTEPRPPEGLPALAKVPEYEEPFGAAVLAVLDDVRARSADIFSFATALVMELNATQPSPNVTLLIDGANTAEEKAALAVQMLASARIPARKVYGLPLVDGARDIQPRTWLQVNNGERWQTLDPLTGAIGLPDDVLLWWQGEAPLFEVTRSRNAVAQFSAIKSVEPALSTAASRSRAEQASLSKVSLLDLPVQTQNLYRVLLLIPLGALLIVMLRNIIGVQTFGTFMPVLIALSFRETQLVGGVVLFTLIVALGLTIRFYLERLKLLLVPRLAAVVITVILLMALVTIASHRMNLEIGLSVALFPMVILAMTIERMSIVWEELGAGDAIRQGIGSLIVAAACYLLMFHPQVEHLVFVFPELLLLVLGITLLVGRYTGYRLTELRRFRDLAK